MSATVIDELVSATEAFNETVKRLEIELRAAHARLVAADRAAERAGYVTFGTIRDSIWVCSGWENEPVKLKILRHVGTAGPA